MTLKQALLGTLLLVACDQPAMTTSCVRDSNCPQGQHCQNGVCIKPIPVPDASQPDSRPPARDLLTPFPDRPPSDGLKCSFNHDDKIDREEMPIVAGTGIKYMIGTGLSVDLQGKSVAGRTEWDLTSDASDDKPFNALLEPVASWVASAFPTATYMSLINPLSYPDVHGVFKATSSALQLLAVVSKTPNATKVTYEQPIDVLRFPITPKDSFSTKSWSSGYMDPYPCYVLVPVPVAPCIWNHETYQVDVIAAGDLKLPELTLPVVLEKITVEQYTAYAPYVSTTKTTFNFISECYGIVAQVKVDGDPGSKLSALTATERRRITK